MRFKYSCVLFLGMWNGAAALENSMAVPQKLKIEIVRYSNSTSGYIPKRIESSVWGRDVCTPMFIVALFVLAKR